MMQEAKLPLDDNTGPVPPDRREGEKGEESQGEVKQVDGVAQVDRPDWLDPKFKSTEELQKAYNELQKQLGGKEKEPEPKEEPKGEAKEPEGKGDLKIPKPAEDEDPFAKYVSEWDEKGELSADSRKELTQKHKIPDQLIDTFLAGREALAAQQASSIYGLVGGEQSYQQMVEWASRNLDESSISAYDKAVSSGDMATIQFAVRGLQAQWQSSGAGVQRVEGGRPAGLKPFQNERQLVEAMRDPRYKESSAQFDPAYHEEVKQRAAASDLFGIPGA